MANICGYLNLDDYTYVDIPAPMLPSPPFPPNTPMQAYFGIGAGSAGGMKSKMDYNKNLWFIGTDRVNGSTVNFLVRVTRVGNVVSMAYKQIPLPPNSEYTPEPNQVTIDKNGNVYMPVYSGPQRSYYVGKVTNAQAADPANWVITWYQYQSPYTQGDTYATLGISLSKDHSKLVTCLFTDSTSRYVCVINTTTMAMIIEHEIQDVITGTYPYNIETNVSGGLNDGWAFFVDPRVNANTFIVGINLNNPSDAPVSTQTVDEDKTIIIKPNGDVVTGTKNVGNPTSIETTYPPLGGGSVDRVNFTQQYVTLPQYQLMNHGDIDRLNVDYPRYWTGGGYPFWIQGETREVKDASQTTRVQVSPYAYISTAAEREPYV